MNEVNTSRVEDIFCEAIEIESQEKRTEFVSKACADDSELQRQVMRLIEAHVQAGQFLHPRRDDKTSADAISERPGTVIDRYKLLQELGAGGFGVVFMAEQLEDVRRKVAVKIIKPGMDTREVIARFEAERQALALMNHPNIARVLDAGATASGRPFFVMELIQGIPITDYCDQQNCSTAERLKLFQTTCNAVQHAHQKGIIHRDLKPSNILVTLHDGDPVVKIIDFGVSKALNQQLTEKALFTRFGQMLGTPQYMSPEQAEMSGLDIDTRSDIYALGVLLYELLTGRPPFDAETFRKAGWDEMRRIIRDQEPTKPSTQIQLLDQQAAGTIAAHRNSRPNTLSNLIRGDLDWIVMKALEKKRERRYDTASNLAEDIERHLRHEPTSAGPPTYGYRLWKSIRRNRTLVGVGSALAISLLLGLGVALSGVGVLRHELEATRLAQAQLEQEKKQLANKMQTLQRNLDALQKVNRNSEVDRARNLIAEGIKDKWSGNFEKSLHMFYVALDSAQKADEKTLESKAHFELGNSYYLSQDTTNAVRHWRDAVASYPPDPENYQDRELEMLCELYSFASGLASDLGDYDLGVALNRKTVSIAQHVFGPGTNRSVRWRGQMANGLVMAEDRTREAHQIFSDIRPVMIRAVDGGSMLSPYRSTDFCLMTLCELVHAMSAKESDEQQVFLDSARRYAQRAGNSLGWGEWLRARIETEQGNFEQALELHRAGIDSIKHRSAVPGRAWFMRALERDRLALLVELGRLDEADTMLQGAIDYRDTLLKEDHPDRAYVRQIYGDFLRDRGRTQEAIPQYEAAFGILNTAEFAPHKRKLELLDRLVAITNEDAESNEATLKWKQQREEEQTKPDLPVFAID